MHDAVGESKSYDRWRDSKLAAYPLDQASLWVEIDDPGRLDSGERRALGERCSAFNLAFYTTSRRQNVARQTHEKSDAQGRISRVERGEGLLQELDGRWIDIELCRSPGEPEA